ncbi:MAG TPA: NAD+ synthase, partial [Bradyrhizobium sp.]|nr:NAD+ synthase [Bradyrhizobium sp.]
VEQIVQASEYKRRQAAPGVKISGRNFGRDRRYPIINKFRDSGKTLPEPDETLVSRASRGSAEAFEG